ncbi:MULTISPECIES: Pls/PosA family non-ribosomal peptide synthetase [unclassified Arthrobacter]|uniref:Pls/PosA family non-ribosomal peptide synthetase n=1 Tax=unclassified Arthrobacter TaxID=235627 RepID=UPI002E049748|nr:MULTISPECIES: Pls/PosA family non-ribosomal peptide synthetase [unclassified Arthrobacter]MEC5192996.1 non-ribosomal peptide synthetase-like protein [Arthrobacter sp. MP_M4]MEC5204496.1 non-ribosomal peptide synthetase-like protein [Arthrobacter sp. MP_M7]
MSKKVKSRSSAIAPAELRGKMMPDGGSGAGTVLTSAAADHSARWRQGERLDQLFEDSCDRLQEQGRGTQIAVDAGDVVLSYQELDARANQLARHLLECGARPGDRIALLFDQPWRAYVAMLAVLKIHAAYVPLDPGFPPDRLKFIVEDADVVMVLSLTHLKDLLPEVAAQTVCLDHVQGHVDAEDPSRLQDADLGEPDDELAYIIYTSGSTGRPKGVAVDQASICNFVRVASAIYGIEPTDRVYQGMTIAFDFSVEEIWVAWMVGATLVPKPGRSSLLGAELGEYLVEKRITALCCVPTLLATLDDDLPGLRFLLVSGEACPRDLVLRWHRPGLRFLNVYGPTEATVTATWSLLDPGTPVSLGVPLPTYTAIIVDADGLRALPPGEMGEIGLAGVGLARGYVNRPDLTERAFIPDFLGIENNPSGRIYRTGDLGRINDAGELEYFGRIDTQVKIRGYRIELSEIESVLVQLPGIAQAVVQTFEPEQGSVELAAYFTLRPDVLDVDVHELHRMLRTRLPGYMVPAYFEELRTIPMMASDKVDRKSLPRPENRISRTVSGSFTAPVTAAEEALAEQLQAVLGLEKVSTDAHFFNDLGADSLLMAHYCARIRKETALPPAAMQDIYECPTVRQLAACLEARHLEAALGTTGPEADIVLPGPPPPVSSFQYAFCGAVQFLCFLGFMMYGAWILIIGYEWTSGGNGLLEMWLRSIGFGVAMFVVLSVTPIIAKWLLVGRWKPGTIRIWSPDYLRFWAVKTLTRANPLVLFAGSPLYVLYLRLMGAKIGKGVVILSRMVPACPDLLTIGDNTVINKNASFLCYRARSGMIEKGTVTLGSNVFVSERTTLDIGTTMGDDSQLGHASSLQAAQAVPAGQVWHGSPAVRTGTNYRRVPAADCSTRRRVIYSLLQLTNRLVLVVPAAVLGLAVLLRPYLATGHLQLGAMSFFADALAVSLVLFIVGLFTGLVAVVCIPRILHRFLTPDVVYPLYGWHFSVHRLIARLSNVRFYKDLFGDSSYIVHYLLALGWNLNKVEQTGSNFGPTLGHESPFLCDVGTGTMVADGLNMMNADYTSSSFRLSTVHIAGRNFLGNHITFPIGAHVGQNVLLATKVMVPIDGPSRRDVGLLGSPPFEIPRSVQRDAQFDEKAMEEAKNRELPAKNRHNIMSMVYFLAVRWVLLFTATIASAVAVTAYSFLGVLAVALAMLALLVFRILVTALVERSVMGFRGLRPQFCSIYDGYFWRHERLWKLLVVPRFNGTPFKPLMWRLLGVKVGKRLYDAGATIPEKTLVTIGDDCTFNEGATIQGHSMEDGTFKSDYVMIGDRCSLGVDVWINYGATMHDGSTLRADALLMKGEDVPEGTSYVGNPAREVLSSGSKHPTRAPRGPKHRALTDASGRPLKSSRSRHGAHMQRHHSTVRV